MVNPDPLLRKRRQRPLIGYMVEYYLCLGCAPGRELCSIELREGDEGAIPYKCERCGKELEADE